MCPALWRSARSQPSRLLTVGGRDLSAWAEPPRYESDVSLNDVQVAVVRWIADGSPAGVFDGYSHRISAAALQTRGLVRIVGRGATWRAALTDPRSGTSLPRPATDTAHPDPRASLW